MTMEDHNAKERRKVDQVEIYEIRLQSILDAIAELKKQLEAANLVADAREREHTSRLETLMDLIRGSGHAGTGICPRLNLVEVKAEANLHEISKLEERLEKYIEAKTEDERKLYRGILAALGTAVLSLLGQLAMFLFQHLAKGALPHG